MRRRFLPGVERPPRWSSTPWRPGERLDLLAAPLRRRPHAVLAALRRRTACCGPRSWRSSAGSWSSPSDLPDGGLSVLESVLGIRLLLWAGATVPTPRPELRGRARSRSRSPTTPTAGDGFQLTLRRRQGRLGGWDVLESGAFALMNRVWIAARHRRRPRGADRRHRDPPRPAARPGAGPLDLTVTGSDLTVKLDLEERNEAHTNQPDSVIVTKLLGALPAARPGPAGDPDHRRADRAGPRPPPGGDRPASSSAAAERNGFVFYLEPLTLGVTTAYWGPVVRRGLPQPALTLGMGRRQRPHRCRSATTRWRRSPSRGSFVEPFTQAERADPAAARRCASRRWPPARARGAHALLRDTASRPGRAALASAAAATSAPEPVSGEGELDAVRYGAVLRARGLVGVRGAGPRLRRLLLRPQRDPHDRGRRVHASASRLSREGTGSLLAGGAAMNGDDAVLRQVPRHRQRQRRPAADRPDQGQGARRVRRRRERLGDAVRAVRRRRRRGSSPCRPNGAGRVDRVRARRPRLPDLVGLLVGRRRRAAPGAAARRRAEQVMIVTAGGTRSPSATSPGRAGSPWRRRTGAKIAIDPTGIEIDNGQGAT